MVSVTAYMGARFARRIATLRSTPVYPLALVSAFLVTELIEFWIPITGLLRSMIVLGGMAIAIQIAVSIVAGRDRGAYAAAIVLMAAFDLKILAFLFGVATLLLVVSSLRHRRLVPLDWPHITKIFNLVGVASLLLAIANAIVLTPRIPTGVLQTSVHPTGNLQPLPDVYLILLDAYPRADTLMSVLGHDNSAFLERMRAIGFDVASNAHSNYNRTSLTVTSMLNAKHIQDLMPDPPSGILAQHRHMSSLINSAVQLSHARSIGYTVVAVPTQLSFLAPNTADRFLDAGEMTQFEYALPRNGLLKHVLPDRQVAWFRQQHRDRVLSGFASLDRLPTAGSELPRFVFAHVMTPHDPIVFRSDGSLAAVPECFWDECNLQDPLSEELKSALREQVEYTNGRVLEVTERIVQQSPRPPVIVVMSDHGFRHWMSDGPETFRSLLLSYTPGHPGLFPDNATPINVIPRILNTYAGASVALATEDSWVTLGGPGGYFPFARWFDTTAP